jgi:uncharacterized protein (TIGR02145 family)
MKSLMKVPLMLLICLHPVLLSGQNRHILQHRLYMGENTARMQVEMDITELNMNTKPIYHEAHLVEPDVSGHGLLMLGSVNTMDTLSFKDRPYFVRFWVNQQPHSIFQLNSRELGQWLSRGRLSYTFFLEEDIRSLSELVRPLPFGSDFTCNDYLFFEGGFYRTTQIGSQCWLAENLNVGTRINSRDEQGKPQQQGTDCFQIEKYCYYDDERNCDWTGGLYMWAQAMCGANHEKAQGICPDGWHIPSHNEWTILERFICNDAGNSNCEQHFLLAEQEERLYEHHEAFRGTNEGALLRASFGWDVVGFQVETQDKDLYGFSALPGRIRWGNGAFRPTVVSTSGCWLSSTQAEFGYRKWSRMILSEHSTIFRRLGAVINGVSVRCVKDD